MQRLATVYGKGAFKVARTAGWLKDNLPIWAIMSLKPNKTLNKNKHCTKVFKR